MSDFGSMVTAHGVDKTSTTPEDEKLVKTIANELVFGQQYRVSDYADFELRFGGSTDEESNGIMIGLTQYFGEDVDAEGLSDDYLIARDLPLAEQFAAEMQEKLGAAYRVDAYSGHW